MYFTDMQDQWQKSRKNKTKDRFVVIPETKRLVEGSAGGVAGVAALIGGGMKVEVENSRLKLRGAAAATLIAILGFGLGGLTLNLRNLGHETHDNNNPRFLFLEREDSVITIIPSYFDK